MTANVKIDRKSYFLLKSNTMLVKCTNLHERLILTSLPNYNIKESFIFREKNYFMKHDSIIVQEGYPYHYSFPYYHCFYCLLEELKQLIITRENSFPPIWIRPQVTMNAMPYRFTRMMALRSGQCILPVLLRAGLLVGLK